MKVIHGMSEVAGQGIYTVQGLRNNNVDADMAVWQRNPMGYPVDIDIKINKKKKYLYPLYVIKMVMFAVKALVKYDVLHSHFGYSLLPLNLDVKVLKLFNKKIFVEFHGSEIRFVFNNIKYKFYNHEAVKESINNKQRKRLLKLIKHCDGIILHDEELKSHLPDVKVPVYIVPLRLDLSKFEPLYPENKKIKPIIVHAPSKRKGKGTEEILKGLEKVQGQFELILVEGKTQEEAFEIYKKADIIIDQISVGTYGVFAIEAMALGKPVITYISDEMEKSLPSELPIVSATFDNISKIIDELIEDGDKRQALGMAGREYAVRYHDNVKVAKYLKDIYLGKVEDNNLFNLL